MVTFPLGRIEQVADDLVVIYSTLGPDYVAVCATHRWASLESSSSADLPTCPHCTLDHDNLGTTRFEAIQARLMPPEAQP